MGQAWARAEGRGGSSCHQVEEEAEPWHTGEGKGLRRSQESGLNRTHPNLHGTALTLSAADFNRVGTRGLGGST